MLYDKASFPVYYWEVSWKTARKFPVDIFVSLESFCVKNPNYSKADLTEELTYNGYEFEDSQLKIKRIPLPQKGIPNQRPQLRDNFFWDVKVADIDWQIDYVFVIERVLARGIESEFAEIVRFYGLETVLNTFRNQASFWPEGMEDNARLYFNLDPEDLLVYHRRRLRDGWNVWSKNYS